MLDGLKIPYNNGIRLEALVLESGSLVVKKFVLPQNLTL